MNTPDTVLTQTKPYRSSDQDTAIESFLKAFYTNQDGVGNFVIDNESRKYPGPLDFWRMAEEIEMAEDIYDRTHDDSHKQLVIDLLKGFTKVHGPDWSENIYNDDLMWITMATVRAYQITQNKQYFTQAKACFDLTWERAYDSVNGGLWWTTDNTSKNACISGPAAVAALLLFQSGAGEEYLDKAKAAFDWERTTLYEPNGLIHDNISAEGVVHGGVTSYNQGTFIGAAHLLNKLTGTQDYEPYALAAARHTRDHYTDQHAVIMNEYEAGKGESDNAGFKGIFARWCGLWARETGNTEILSWLNENAQTVIDHQNTQGLTWGHWGAPTPEKPVTAWECSCAVSLLQNVPPPK